MDLRRQMTAAVAARRADAAAAARRYREQSRRRLMRIIRTKHLTALIGAISRFEEHLGRVWGHGLPDAALTPDQRAWRDAWARCRAAALDNGNNQLRALEKELEQYTVEWARYQTTLPVVAPETPQEDPQ